jgi:hypothetical protein
MKEVYCSVVRDGHSMKIRKGSLKKQIFNLLKMFSIWNVCFCISVDER